MKYIKTFEKLVSDYDRDFYRDYIYKISQPVKVIGDNQIYIIDGYDIKHNRVYDNKTKTANFIKSKIYRLRRYEDIGKFANDENFYSWYKEDDLEPAKDYEIQAIKYNL